MHSTLVLTHFYITNLLKNIKDPYLPNLMYNSEEDMCIMGNVRVNFTNLQKVAACQRRVTIIAKYTTDDWVTSQETKAMIVKAQSHPALSHFITKGKR